METTTFSGFRASLKRKLDKVTDDHDLLVVNRKGNQKDVVVMSLQDYNSMQETLYLLSSKINAEKLRIGIEQLRKGKVVKKSLRDL